MIQTTIAAMWATFRQSVVPKDATEDQVHDVQIAFYAGAASMISVMRQIGEDDDTSVDEGGKLMMALEHEVKKFTVELMASAMATAISKATGAEVHARVHDVTKPPAGGVH